MSVPVIVSTMHLSNIHRAWFLSLMDFDLNDSNVRSGTDVDLVAIHIENFLSSWSSEKITHKHYCNGDGTVRLRSMFSHFDGQSVIIVEVYTPPAISMSPPTECVFVYMDRYQLHKTEKVYSSVSFGIKGIRRLSLGVFFDQLTWNFMVTGFMT